MANTTNYNLKKPAQDDFYNVDDFNGNADIIDTQLKINADKASAALPESSFTGAQILSKMAAAGSILPVANGGTGETSLNTFLKYKGNIGVGNDANSYIESGTYQAVGGASNLPNVGDIGYGTLVVLSNGGYLIQFYYTTTGLGLWRISNNNSSVWSSWIEMIDTSNLAAQVQSLLTGGNISVVRQIIKGTVSISNSEETTVAISLTNASKAYVILDGSGKDAADGVAMLPYLKSLTNTAMTLKNNWSDSYTASYQIIEFN